MRVFYETDMQYISRDVLKLKLEDVGRKQEVVDVNNLQRDFDKIFFVTTIE